MAVSPRCACGAKCAKVRPEPGEEDDGAPDMGYWQRPLPGGVLGHPFLKSTPMRDLPSLNSNIISPEVRCVRGCVGSDCWVEWRSSGVLSDGLSSAKASAVGRDVVTRLLGMGRREADAIERASWDNPIGATRAGGVKRDWLKR